MPRARRRKVLRPDRFSTDEARSPPARSACFAHPAPGWLLGSRTVVLVDLLEIYNDAFCSSCPWRRLWPSLACYHPFSATAAPQTEWRGGNHGSSGVLPAGPCWLFSRALFSCRVHEQPFFGGCSYDLPEREDAESPALSPCSCACPKIPRPSMLSLSRRGRRPRSSLSTMPTLPPLRSQSGPPHGATHPNRLCVTTS